ncbi:MAG: hypothetical protein JNN05_00490, partial [Candidatus Omnitrophica bacterium]|nr:hypothetical protein [Candidatus Omnitrophota bacterium]
MKISPYCPRRIFQKLGVFFLLTAFLFNMLAPAQAENILGLPAPGTMIDLSPGFVPPFLKGLVIHPQNPFQIDFIVDPGFSKLQG